MEPEFAKEVIDAIALQKMNALYWHLTDIKAGAFPSLLIPNSQKLAVFESEANGEITGGFYTKEDIQDILAFAAERHVTVIPEIEMPGHCRAALAAYLMAELYR